jgi:hypothetical protein
MVREFISGLMGVDTKGNTITIVNMAGAVSIGRMEIDMKDPG